MREPGLVADCAAAMIEAAGPEGPEITVKCRIGVDDQDPARVLPDFVDRVATAGVQVFAVHARKAWLEGLSPKENRDIPPLDYPLVHGLKRDRPELGIIINGGIGSLAEARDHLRQGVDGAMIGRAAYHDPAGLLAGADALITGAPSVEVAAEGAVRAMFPYIARELEAGTRIAQITRHMLGAFAGRPGARRWRQILSAGAHRPGAGLDVVERALECVAGRQPVPAA